MFIFWAWVTWIHSIASVSLLTMLSRNLVINTEDRLIKTPDVNLLKCPDEVFQGQYLPILGINYVAINRDLEKLPPQQRSCDDFPVLEVRFEFSFILIGKSTMTFSTGQSWRVLKSWYTGDGPEQGFRRCFADGLIRVLVSSVAQSTTTAISLK